MTQQTAPNLEQIRPAKASSTGTTFLLPACTLWRREMVRFFREKNRIASALLTPFLMWIGLGAGLSSVHFSMAAGPIGGSVSYMQYIFPGMVTMILLFTAIFSTITIIEDRREGFLQGVLTSPASRQAIVTGKILGGATLAMGQGIIFLALWPAVSNHFAIWTFFAAAGVMIIISISLTALGLCIAWMMDSTAGFHAIMMLVLMPMWFLSGAVFPLSTAPLPMKILMYADPLTYGQSALAGVMHGQMGDQLLVRGTIAWPVMIVVAITLVAMAGAVASRTRKDGK